MFALFVALCITQAEPATSRWEKDIVAIEKKHVDAKPGGIAFVGSSSIVKWKLDKSFPDWPVYNCGFGGSIIKDSTQYAKRIINPLKPKTIVFYAGDNDIAAKRSPQQVSEDYQAFVKEIHAALPKTVIYFLAIKPSVKRWEQYDKQTEANKLVKEFIAKDERLKYIDTIPLMLGKDGKPDPALFVADGLHLSEAGYAKWNEVMKKTLAK
jgi:lysophospholipase L1-like esterase